MCIKIYETWLKETNPFFMVMSWYVQWLPWKELTNTKPTKLNKNCRITEISTVIKINCTLYMQYAVHVFVYHTVELLLSIQFFSLFRLFLDVFPFAELEFLCAHVIFWKFQINKNNSFHIWWIKSNFSVFSCWESTKYINLYWLEHLLFLSILSFF